MEMLGDIIAGFFAGVEESEELDMNGKIITKTVHNTNEFKFKLKSIYCGEFDCINQCFID